MSPQGQPFTMVVVTEDDFVSMSTAPRAAIEDIVKRVREGSVEDLCAWAVQLMRLTDPGQNVLLLHAFLLTTVIERHEQLGYEMQNLGERS